MTGGTRGQACCISKCFTSSGIITVTLAAQCTTRKGEEEEGEGAREEDGEGGGGGGVTSSRTQNREQAKLIMKGDMGIAMHKSRGSTIALTTWCAERVDEHRKWQEQPTTRFQTQQQGMRVNANTCTGHTVAHISIQRTSCTVVKHNLVLLVATQGKTNHNP